MRHRPGAGDPQKPSGDHRGRRTSPGDWPLCLVANEQYHQFRALLVHADPDGDTLTLSARELDMLKCHAGDQVRMVRLIPEEKTA